MSSDAPIMTPELVVGDAEKVLTYSLAHHPLPSLIAPVLECAEGEALTDLHLRCADRPLPRDPPLCPTLQHAFKLAGRKLPVSWKKQMGPQRNRKIITKLLASPEFNEWLRGYEDWVRAVVVPSVGEDIYYQRPPTLRVAMPAHKATIGIHCDADYPGHHPGEINFCARPCVRTTPALPAESSHTASLHAASRYRLCTGCPLVEVANSNALWLESSPGRGDFAPRPLCPGEVLRCDGHKDSN